MSRSPKKAATIPEVLDDELGPRRQPLELLAAADARKFVLIAAQQEIPAKLPTVWLEENRPKLWTSPSCCSRE